MHIKRRAIMFAIFLAPILAHAGAWGPDSFENDDALDWAADCVRSTGTQVIAAALNEAIESPNLEAHEASSAVAAAEVIAAARGKGSTTLPSELRGWLQRQSRTDIAKLAPTALKAIERVANAPNSELAALWKESKNFSSWQRSMQDLQARLR